MGPEQAMNTWLQPAKPWLYLETLQAYVALTKPAIIGLLVVTRRWAERSWPRAAPRP